jgi:pantetheine-phosphate adenylyltransferase
MNKRRAICPGSYDPITIGHAAIIIKAAELFDEVIVAVGENTTKKYLFEQSKRLQFISQAFKNYPNISVCSYAGLTIDYCKKNDIGVIWRGIRNTMDYEYEKAIAAMNSQLAPEIETIFINAQPEHAAISSTIIREIYLNGGNVASFLPPGLEIPKQN